MCAQSVQTHTLYKCLCGTACFLTRWYSSPYTYFTVNSTLYLCMATYVSWLNCFIEDTRGPRRFSRDRELGSWRHHYSASEDGDLNWLIVAHSQPVATKKAPRQVLRDQRCHSLSWGCRKWENSLRRGADQLTDSASTGGEAPSSRDRSGQVAGPWVLSWGCPCGYSHGLLDDINLCLLESL